MTSWTEPPLIVAGSSHRVLARAVAEALHVPCRHVIAETYADGEQQVSLEESVRNERVFLLQTTSVPVERNLFELLLMGDACRRAGAREVIALVPYLAYARQDRRARGRESVGARVVADLMEAAHVDRVVAIDVHTAALEGFFSIPLEHLSAFPLLLGALGDWPRERGVVVAPDLGAAKLAQRFARALDVPMAVVQKTRISDTSVETSGVTGDVRDRVPLIVDDMISTGGTIEAAAQALLARGCARSITVLATHGLFVGNALERFSRLPITRVVVTDSVPGHGEAPLRIERASVTTLLAQAVSALALGQSLEPMISHQ